MPAPTPSSIPPQLERALLLWLRLWPPAPWSLRRQLLVGILLPVVLSIGFNTISLYRESLQSLHTAYDRTLLASAKSIGEQLDVNGYDEHAQLLAIVPYSALELFEADNQSRMFYRVSTLDGHLVSGFDELPFWRGRIPTRPPYAALVDFYDAEFRGQPVRVAVLLQPVASATGRSMAVIQVAETLELRRTQALHLLGNTLWRQALLVLLVVLTVLLVVQRVTRPVRHISQSMAQRPQGDLSPLESPAAPRELQPLLDATNQVMDRLRQLLDHQQRFVRDAAHQLRTPLAVLKTQVQSARRGDMPPEQALAEIETTVDRATQLANQMLALAKVEQLRQAPLPADPIAWDAIVREVALDLAPLVADKTLDFELQADTPVWVQAPSWMLRELVRNLLHNAIRHAPGASPLRVQLQPAPSDNAMACLRITDSGPGLSAELQSRLFRPFSAGDGHSGSGLGLAICHEIVQALQGTLQLHNRHAPNSSALCGLDAEVRLPQLETPLK